MDEISKSAAYWKIAIHPKTGSQVSVTPVSCLTNGCENMVLEGKVFRPFFIGKSEVQIRAHCKKTNQTVDEPHIGCGECHSLPPVFIGEPPRDTDPAD